MINKKILKKINTLKEFKNELQELVSYCEVEIEIQIKNHEIIYTNNEDRLNFYKLKKSNLIDSVHKGSVLYRLEINDFQISINVKEFDFLFFGLVEPFLANCEKQKNKIIDKSTKQNDLKEIDKGKTELLFMWLKEIEKSIWFAFYNSKIEILKGGSNFENENDFYPFKELKNYDLFCIYVDENIIDPYIDFSYLFQRLLSLKLIYPTTQKDFFNWLLKNDFITQKNYDLFIEKGQFYALNKCTTPARESNFNNLFKV